MNNEERQENLQRMTSAIQKIMDASIALENISDELGWFDVVSKITHKVDWEVVAELQVIVDRIREEK